MTFLRNNCLTACLGSDNFMGSGTVPRKGCASLPAWEETKLWTAWEVPACKVTAWLPAWETKLFPSWEELPWEGVLWEGTALASLEAMLSQGGTCLPACLWKIGSYSSYISFLSYKIVKLINLSIFDFIKSNFTYLFNEVLAFSKHSCW